MRKTLRRLVKPEIEGCSASRRLLKRSQGGATWILLISKARPRRMRQDLSRGSEWVLSLKDIGAERYARHPPAQFRRPGMMIEMAVTELIAKHTATFCSEDR